MTIVLYIDSMRRGGAERVMSILANSFAEDGYRVVLVTDIPTCCSKDNYIISDKIKRICIDPKVKNPLLKNYKRIISLRGIVKREKASVVLSFLGPQNLRMLISTFRLKCKKCVSVRNDPNVEYGKNIFIRRLTTLIFGLADICVFQTNEAKKYFGRAIQKKSVVIQNPIDEKFFRTKRVSSPKNIITVGRLEHQKNQKLLIDAFSLIADRVSDNLLIYGVGSLYDELDKYIDEIGMHDRIILMGEFGQIDEELAKGRLFVLSSDFEGMPNALMEAMAVDLPCISTDCPCGGPRDLLDDRWLVPCNNAALLSEKIMELYKWGCALNNRRRVDGLRAERIVSKWKNVLFSEKGDATR